MESAQTRTAAERFVAPFLDDLRALVDINSGSYTPTGVAAVADYLQPRFEALGCAVERVPGRAMGPQLIVRREGSGAARPLLIGHMDTVFPDGEAERRPFTIHDETGTATGPGVFDMKSGLLVGLYALRLLVESGEAPYSAFTFILNSDEEIGSPESHALVERLAEQADAALVLEPSADPDRLTVARKGVGMFRLEVTGVSAHAGVEPERGRSAIVELAHRVLALNDLNGVIPDVTVNVGVVAGGERTNVVADRARAEIDIRVPTREARERIEARLRQVGSETTLEGTTAHIEGSFVHEPFEQSEDSKRLFGLAEQAGAELGLTLRGEPTGGGSDGNTTAAAGVPTLDGLGLVGGLAHNPGEYVRLDSIPTRIALLAGMLRRLDAQR